MIETLQTDRLLLRAWKDEDLEPFYRLNADPEVMAHFPAVLNRQESDKLAERIQQRIVENGWGFWAVEEKASGSFAGFVGLNRPQYELPFSPCIEVGWRLDKLFWRKGFATEAGRKSLAFAFEELTVPEVVAFTTVTNKKSQAVMQRLGMIDTGENFMHPQVPSSSPLCEHVLYKITNKQWQQTGRN